ncbi:MAG TPA: hypothetical protein VII11_01100, partial [Bacteroidota bacterium]
IRLELSLLDTLYRLPSEFILSGSESVWLDSTLRLTNGVDYTMDYRFGRLTFPPNVLRQIFSGSPNHALLVTYKRLPLAFKPEYTLRRKVTTTDTTTGRDITVVAPAQQPLFDDFFGAGLQKSGSVARGFTLGTNRDLSLSSGFRMQLAGSLAQDVDIVAALTDENTPIQPEGTTQTLQEVDKVFVELKAPRYSATLGDFNLEVGERNGGEFGRLFRKLQGASGSFNLWQGGTSSTKITLTGATQRGKFNTNQFQGVEGNQGPYRLVGRNGERRILVIAGTERVYLNGERMTRGETNDYTIDYSTGEVFFSSKRLITNASRISIDFEYTDRQFTRNLLAGGVDASLFNNTLKINARYLQEADDPDSPLEGTLDADARSLLAASGADRFKASLPGARFVGTDSLTDVGLGQYGLKDTVIVGKPVAIFVYAPGTAEAVFSVLFSSVDQMPPDSIGYVRVGIGHFRFAGIGQGNYLPVQFLPIPQRHRLLDLNTSAALGANVSISGEYAVSQVDQNRLSSLDDGDQQGTALKLALRFKKDAVTVGTVNIGDVDVSISERLVDRRFASLDRYNEVEFSRNWNLESVSVGDEEIREASLSLKPGRGLTMSAKYGLLDLQDIYRSTRLQTDIALKDSAQNRVQYRREDIRSSNLLIGEGSQWVRQRGEAEYTLGVLQPGIRVESEERALSSSRADSLRQGSFQFVEIAPRLATRDVSWFRASAEFQIRSEDSVTAGTMQTASHSLTQSYNIELKNAQNFTSQWSLHIRKTKFTDLFRSRGNIDADVVLVRTQTRYAPYDRAFDATVFYEFANQRASRYERVFLRVQRGTGNYQYKGDLNGNGIAEEDEFELSRFDGDYIVLYAPSDQLFPILDLKSSFRLRIEPERLIRQPSTVMQKVLNALSAETLFRVEGKSTEPDARQIYFLNLSRFLNERTTIAGTTNFTQDVYVYERRADFSMRFRFIQRKSLLQLVAATEKGFNIERSVRVRSQLLPEIGNQTDFVYKVDRVIASSATPRERDLSANSLSSDFAYRPEPAWELGFRFEVARVVDHDRSQHPTVDLNEQSVRTSYALFGTGNVRAELKREEAVLTQGAVDPTRPFPYEFTNGKVIGKSLLWQLAFDYRFSQHMQVVLQYNGRKEGSRAIVHTGQVEAKVFF